MVKKNHEKQVINIDRSNLNKIVKIEHSSKLVFLAVPENQNKIILDVLPNFPEIDLEIIVPENMHLQINELLDKNIKYSDFKYSVRVKLGVGSVLNFNAHENTNEKFTISIKRIFELDREAVLNFTGTQFGSEKNNQQIESILKERAVSNLSQLIFLNNSQRAELKMKNEFNEESGGGEIKIKAVSKDKSQAKIDGMIKIGSKANKTNTYLKQDVLMLDERSKINAIPSLEIDTNDVKASHGVSISKIGTADLFYLQSRGIDQTQAQSIIIEGFLNELLEENLDLNFRETILESIREKQLSN